MKDKIIEILKHAYHWGRDNGEGRSEKNFNDFLETSTFKDFIDSISTINRDKVMEVLNNNSQKSVIGNAVEEADFKYVTDALCSLSLPTLSEGEIDDILYVLDNYLGDTDPFLDDDMTDDDIKQEEPILWVHMKLTALKQLTKPKEE
jgi:hypothetical protein